MLQNSSHVEDQSNFRLSEVELAYNLVKLLEPETVSQQEEAVQNGQSYGFIEVVSRPIATPNFVGCVAVQYSNNDGDFNDGYQEGTRTVLIVAGIIGGPAISYEDGPDMYWRQLQAKARSYATRKYAANAMGEALTVLSLHNSTVSLHKAGHNDKEQYYD